MAISDPFRLSSQSKDDEFPTLPRASNKLAASSNPGLTLALFQVPKYIKDDLQQICITVFEAQTPTYGQDQEISEDPPKRALKTRVSDVYKG